MITSALQKGGLCSGGMEEGSRKESDQRIKITGLCDVAILHFLSEEPYQLASLDPHFPERKTRSFAFQVMLNFSPVRGLQLADTSLALALAPQGVRNDSS